MFSVYIDDSGTAPERRNAIASALVVSNSPSAGLINFPHNLFALSVEFPLTNRARQLMASTGTYCFGFLLP